MKSVVQIGARPGAYNANVTAADGAQRCYAVPSYSSGALHQVVVGLGEEGSLAATSTYFYRWGRAICTKYRSLNTAQRLLKGRSLIELALDRFEML